MSAFSAVGLGLPHRLSEAWHKNSPELKALLSGRMPAFVLSGRAASQVPVFVFHEVEPARFEAQLRFLRANGYRSLGADELEIALRQQEPVERAVALTFDDATRSFWAFAFPLLRRYGFQAILFAIAGLVPDDAEPGPSLDDVRAGRCSLSELRRLAAVQPLCTWRELTAMHASGLVDIQSHSFTHARVAVSPRVVDFLHPDFDTYFFGNVNIPNSSLDHPGRPERRLRLGAPVFESASRMAARRGFKANLELIDATAGHVAAHGGAAFFATPTWRRELERVLAGWPEDRRGVFESGVETEHAMRFEFEESRRVVEQRLGKTVQHFCYPWFEGSQTADRLAAEAGYHTVHYGLSWPRVSTTQPPLLRVPRISEAYLATLPGAGRRGLAAVWAERVHNFARRSRGARP